MNSKPKVAIFASGSGSNFQVITDAASAGELHADIVAVVTDKPQAFVVERAKTAGVAVVALRPSDFASKVDYEEAILQELKQLEVEWLVLAGYMRLIGDTLLTAYANRIVNIHPSLLPSFPGKDAIGQALAHGVKVTGVTVHYVDAGMDTGPILSQQAVEVVEGNREQTEHRIHAVEHELYTKTLQQLWMPTASASQGRLNKKL
ncbi:phosphoribosylglycinamide formyltransferase [Paenisporosarcina quisquiliarum]|uniref:Phosphoribosylglycinamide formyltransferase n=1 Tax=Paenisporosarcina quisquiliarum TaxID=365346 RepID=A0A9X3LIP3_9BACL|nr:phosphoribosylglycinamide formyltransferase [Paenisporosarcina quisquiliarum]MCZ8537174.1 phosphoribosylglycinamide formyltransferase [Paenisporosarcina quisquiliarum]